jgi:hypothetical protein
MFDLARSSFEFLLLFSMGSFPFLPICLFSILLGHTYVAP